MVYEMCWSLYIKDRNREKRVSVSDKVSSCPLSFFFAAVLVFLLS